MSKIDFEKLRRQLKAKAKVASKPGAVTDFAGDDEQDNLLCLVPAKGTVYKPGRWWEERFKALLSALRLIESGVYMRASHIERKNFVRDFAAIHIPLKSSVLEGYKLTPEFRKAERFIESNRHLLDADFCRKFV